MRKAFLIPALAAYLASTMWRPAEPARPLDVPELRNGSALSAPVTIEIVEGRARIERPREERNASLETTLGAPISVPRATRPRTPSENPVRRLPARR